MPITDIFAMVGQIVLAATALAAALKPLIALANKGKTPDWLTAVLTNLDRLNGIFAINGKPFSTKK